METVKDETMNKLQVDDFQAGMNVTVYDLTPNEVETGSGGFMGGTVVRRVENLMYRGDVLRVVAVDMPFVVVEVLCHGSGMMPFRLTGMGPTRASLDTRRYSFKKLSDEYVDALLARKAQP